MKIMSVPVFKVQPVCKKVNFHSKPISLKGININPKELFIKTLTSDLKIPFSESEMIFEDLKTISDRGYHGLSHCENMLQNMEKYIASENYKPQNKALFRLAIFTHDRFPDVDESIQYALNILNKSEDTNIKSSSNRKILYGLIHSTDHMKNISEYTDDEKLISDLDLFILGSDPKTYLKYKEGIRDEYKNVDIKTFSKARIEILNKFLCRNSIYKLPFFKTNYENNARKNLSAEIKELKNNL